MNALRMALDSIREKKGRSFLTMLGIIIGVTAVLVLVALVSGYNADITAYYEKLGVNKVNVTVNWYDASRSVDVMDALYDYGNGELGDMVLGVSPRSVHKPAHEIPHHHAGQRDALPGQRSVLRLRELHPEGGAGHQRL